VEPINEVAELETPYVFIDTQAFRKSRFDWSGTTLSKLVELVRDGHIHLLTTSITKREISAQLAELLSEAKAALSKHVAILKQLSAADALEKIEDVKAVTDLEAKFDEFLKATSTVEVPLSSDVASIVDDYFERRPPFSSKKKSEFPDAIVVASLKAWAGKNSTRIYVVSQDPDLKACCEGISVFIHSESISDVISKAIVSKATYDSLIEAVSYSEALSDEISLQLKETNVTVPRRSRYVGSRRAEVTGRVRSVSGVNIFNISVLERDGDEFRCEIEFEADIELRVRVEIEGEYGFYGEDDYSPPEEHDLNQTVNRSFGAEIVLDFDAVEGVKELKSVLVYDNDVEIDTDDVIDLSYLHWR
jgi:hypothetical protein